MINCKHRLTCILFVTFSTSLLFTRQIQSIFPLHTPSDYIYIKEQTKKIFLIPHHMPYWFWFCNFGEYCILCIMVSNLYKFFMDSDKKIMKLFTLRDEKKCYAKRKFYQKKVFFSFINAFLFGSPRENPTCHWNFSKICATFSIQQTGSTIFIWKGID